MHAADDDSSTLLPASAGIERNAADKAESAARAAASRVTAWLQRSPTGPLARASCADTAPSASPGPATKAANDTSGDKPGVPVKDASAEDDAASVEASAPAPAATPTAD